MAPHARKRTPDQLAALAKRQHRRKAKITSIVLMDVVAGNGPDAPTGPKLDKNTKQPLLTKTGRPKMQAAAYHTAFKIASAAWDDFRNGTTSPKRVARQVAYQRCMTMLNRIGSTAILRENNRHVALAGLAPAVAPTKPVVDEDDKFECQSCHKEFALDQRDLRFKDDWFCRTCGEKQKPAPSKPVAPPKAAASPKRPSTPEGSVKPVAPTPTPTPRVERGDWTTMPVLSPQPPGTVADESCPAFREFEAAVYAWEGKGLGRMPDPSQFSGMLWVVPKPKPSKAKLG